ncbi:MAG: gamma-glutamyl-gamma-aminobutyrate hydrolase family protein [Holosporales bacterium]|jgi:putative glutamine amidotransferase|nr:gamma-glutamyl-gamma-aminobutyrate hydrolase family protein [Holosporales bacterium]
MNFGISYSLPKITTAFSNNANVSNILFFITIIFILKLFFPAWYTRLLIECIIFVLPMIKPDLSHIYEIPSYKHDNGITPVIGITIDMIDPKEDIDGSWYSESPWYAIGRRYCDAVVRAGGIPILLCYNLSNVDQYIKTIDGLLITGISSNIDPTFYGENSYGKINVSKPNKTQFEWAMIKKMIDANKPVLGINAGMHLINVICEGTLSQLFIESLEKIEIKDHQQLPLFKPCHEVKIEKNTKIFEFINKTDEFHEIPLKNDSKFLYTETNSYHSQVIKKLGKHLKINAISSSDRIIEGIESTKAKFCVGVQWNAEFLINGIDKALFKAFVSSSR